MGIRGRGVIDTMAKISPPPIRENITDTNGNFNRVWVQWFTDQFNRINERIEQIADVVEGNLPIADADGSLIDSGYDPTSLPHNVHTHELDTQGGKIDHGAALTGLDDIADHPSYVSLDGSREMTADWNIGDNRLGIGTAPAGLERHLQSYYIDTSVAEAYTHLFQSYYTGNHPGGGNIVQYANFFGGTARIVGTQVNGNRHTLYGTYNRALTADPAECYRLTALYNYAGHAHTTNLSILQGLSCTAANTSTGTVAAATGYVGFVTNTAGGTITEAQGVASRITQSAGAITTGYLFHGQYTGTIGTKWGIYLDGETKNYFSGDVTINDKITLEDNGSISLETDTSKQPRIMIDNRNDDVFAGQINFWKLPDTLSDDDQLAFIGGYCIRDTQPQAYMDFRIADESNGHTGGEINFGCKVDDTTKYMIRLKGYNGAQGQGEVIFNDSNADINFIIDKNTAGIAYMYDAGDDDHCFGDGGTTNYLKIDGNGDVSFAGTAGFYPRFLTQADEPAAGTGATQCDTSEMVVWKDSDDNKVYLCFNDGGTVKTAELA